MKLCILIVALILTGTCISGSAWADDPTLRQQLSAEYMKADAAMRSNNIRGLMYRYASDFKLKLSPKKTMNRTEVEDWLHLQLVATKEIKELSFNILSLTKSGDKVLATVRQTETMVYVINRQEHTRSSIQTSEDTWVKTATGWKLKYQELKHLTTTEGGKTYKISRILPESLMRRTDRAA